MKHHLQSVRCWGFASVVAISAPLLGTQVQAAESIFVRYKDTDVTVTQQELNTFTETGELPTSLQNLFSTDQEVPKVLRTVLSEQIEVPEFMQNFLEGSNGDFLFFKLDQAISSTEGRTEVGLESLKKAVLKSIEDDRVSFLEIIDKHPQNTIRVNLTNLEGTYNDVNGFVKKVLPALEVAKDVLSDFICDCKTTQVSPEGSTPASKYQSQQELENCEKAYQR
ncbi:MAG: alpha/beta hydrolase [Acaryochloris sp. CRU_2_0]|nr:alpha/beta hydrolase [Acaryochloris sp. CRU_2_0]